MNRSGQWSPNGRWPGSRADSGAARAEPRLFVELGAGLKRDRPVELRHADEPELEEGLSQPLPRISLNRQSFVDVFPGDCSLFHEHRPEHGPVAAVVVHVYSPRITCCPRTLRGSGRHCQ